MDENECYVFFPVEAFESDNFTAQFNIGLISVLNSNGLESKFETPPFLAIREFFDIKFNFDKDEFEELNP